MYSFPYGKTMGRDSDTEVGNCESDGCSVESDSWQPHGLYSPWNSPGQNTGVSSLSLLQEFFPTQGSNPALPHCRRFLYQLRHKGGPRELQRILIHPTPRRKGVWVNWEIRVDIYTLLIQCIKQITSENLLYSMGNTIQCSLVTQMRKK